MPGRDKDQIPLYSLRDFGSMGVRIVDLSGSAHRETVPHADKFLQIMFVFTGGMPFSLDSGNTRIEAAHLLMILPGRVHAYSVPTGVEGFMFGIEPAIVPREVYRTVSAYDAESPHFIGKDARKLANLRSILSVLAKLADDTESSPNLVFSLGRAVIALSAIILEKNPPPPQAGEAQKTVQRFLGLVGERCTDMKSPSDYASLLGISSERLTKAVGETTGRSPGEWIRSEVVIRAKRLLYFSQAPIADIAARLGYEDSAYFSRLFAKEEGVTPLEFRKLFKA